MRPIKEDRYLMLSTFTRRLLCGGFLLIGMSACAGGAGGVPPGASVEQHRVRPTATPTQAASPTAAPSSSSTADPRPSSSAAPSPSAIPAASVQNAYTFLDLMMDKYATGSTVRLVQSFDGGGVGNFTDAVTYDDALMIDALLVRASADDIARAQVIGNAFLYVQTSDAANDGRLRAAYAPSPLTSSASVVATNTSSDVGNMAWVGQSLVQLYKHTSNAAYLTSAVSIANWIQTNTADTRGAGGYTGGDDSSGAKILWKSTEHNLDVYAFFTMLATESGNSTWTTRAASAQQFVASMWNASGGNFYVGTDNSGITPNTSVQPEDVNSWTYLAFQNPTWANSLTWDVTNLAVNQGGITGVSFCSGDRTGVWLEGTAHLADALKLRNAAGDATKAQAYLSSLVYAQTNGLNNDGLGIIAASKNGLTDCDGDQYYASLHVGATAWYIMAVSGANPFKAPLI
ncbi:MAG TPA: hypothetical protein VGZ00_08040 [Candidatus Baltobacteraceae bacterium]|jgi:hypothetical protein|nr:hypothetical protein [Candidatus Baltobacteraceae bacterium]